MWNNINWFLLQYFLSYVLCDGTYECGEHGRFEYCIDEIPGCVIGCHCHPGYYFDTETKICEPNSKLIEHHRRSYVTAPTRIQTNIVTPRSSFITNPIATTSKIDGAIDEISKDADDLGDWLYNQFFKTIENQVINSTDDKFPFTRRSGSGKSAKKGKERKKLKKRYKNKKSNLRKKLLRITENDSVFDLSSSSNSDSSDSSSDSSGSSFEYKRFHHDDDDEHGHKKIVMIKKKPKQNLPNFIFLPNVETPFYPPLGLLPPPVPMPMYPMVPVPPMIPYDRADCEDINETTTVVPKKTTIEPPTAAATESTTTIITTKHEEPTTEDNVDNQQKVLRHRNKLRKKPLKISQTDKYGNDLRSYKLSSPSRQKFLQKLKMKMQTEAAKSIIPHWKNKNERNIKHEFPYLDNTPESYMVNDIESNTNETAIPDNVDFKYISELIHRVDQNNKSTNLPPIEYNPLLSDEVFSPLTRQDNLPEYVVPSNGPVRRRLSRPEIGPSDESFYANLGRQIASMIRGIDTNNKEINIKLESTNDFPHNNLYFNVNSPKSYWERSARSPLTFLKSNRNEFEYLKKGNELLFDIENKVEIIASTVPTLTLREIENIVNVMESAKRYINTEIIKETIPPKKNLKFQLWPEDLPKAKKLIKNSTLPEYKNKIEVPTTEYITLKIRNKEDSKNLQRFRVVSRNSFAVQQYPQTADIKTAKPASYFSAHSINYYQNPQQILYNAKHIRPTYQELSSRKSLWDNELRPIFSKRRKYFGNVNDFPLHPNKKDSHSEPIIGFPKPQPSYFQHNINNDDNM